MLWTTQLFCTRILYKRWNKSDKISRVKSAVLLEGGVECPDRVTFSEYDTKTVEFLSTSAEKLLWNINEKEIYEKATRKNVNLQFYCTDMQFSNKNNMNSVDVSDQLRNLYSFQHYTRNRKRQWALII